MVTFQQVIDRSGISPHNLRYMGDKGYLGRVFRKNIGRQKNRIYTEKQMEVITLTMGYLEDGFRLPVAIKKAWKIVDNTSVL